MSLERSKLATVTDVVIVGAGPVGLFQVFELGLLGLRAEVVDSLPQVGGQCTELYPEKPIYDIPAIPVCSAKELIERLLEQIRPFAAGMHLGQEVTEITPRADRRFDVVTSRGTRFDAGAVIVAGGVGSFQPRRLALEGAERHEGESVHYRVRDAALFADKELVILGGGDSALDWTLELVHSARSVVLIHRRSEFRAAPVSVKRMLALREEGRLDYIEGQVQSLVERDGRLHGVRVVARDGVTRTVSLDQLLVFWGLHPKLGPIAEWGLELHRRTLRVDTARFQTSSPGIFAVGDINDYPGKKKLILSGFHEAALAAFAVREYLAPGEKVHLQYTTTSPLLQKRLGVGAQSELEDRRGDARSVAATPG
ncbi:MAG TPA: NAD(P)/FAD-dependent oxidoreductase [Steroidobacteraceae bacterium]|nr:NAD(P)/FAD-dependent oxidoreductase [Steroidobacteraceae bacterium]